MRKSTLQYLHRAGDELRSDNVLLEAGQREVFEVGVHGRRNVTLRALRRLLDRLGRFEEMIAVFESRLS
jgi:hypothetical protein